MPKFVKKPVVIEAIQWDGNPNTFRKIIDLNNTVHLAVFENLKEKKGSFLSIGTLEGLMTAQEGDWIIKGVNHELYPCKPDIFEKTYEPYIEK